MSERSIDVTAVEYLWRAPIDHWERDPVPVTTCADALAQGLQHLRLFHSAMIWTRHPDPTRLGGDRALLFERGVGTVHVIGIGTLPAQIRSLLKAGEMPGWQLHRLPEQQTPLEALRSLLISRYYGLLHRSDFATVEEVAATPDAGLLAIRNAGPKFLAAVRHASTTLISRGSGGVDGEVAALASEHRLDLAAALDAVARIRSAAEVMQAALIQLQQALQPVDATDDSPEDSPA